MQWLDRSAPRANDNCVSVLTGGFNCKNKTKMKMEFWGLSITNGQWVNTSDLCVAWLFVPDTLGLSITQTADLLGFSQPSLGMTDHSPSRRKYQVGSKWIHFATKAISIAQSGTTWDSVEKAIHCGSLPELQFHSREGCLAPLCLLFCCSTCVSWQTWWLIISLFCFTPRLTSAGMGLSWTEARLNGSCVCLLAHLNKIHESPPPQPHSPLPSRHHHPKPSCLAIASCLGRGSVYLERGASLSRQLAYCARGQGRAD